MKWQNLTGRPGSVKRDVKGESVDRRIESLSKAG